MSLGGVDEHRIRTTRDKQLQQLPGAACILGSVTFPEHGVGPVENLEETRRRGRIQRGDGHQDEAAQERSHRLEVVAGGLRIRRGHAREPLRLHVDESKTFQFDERFAYRSAGHTEPGLEVLIPEVLAGFEGVIEDGLFDLVGCDLPQGTSLDRLGIGRGNGHGAHPSTGRRGSALNTRSEHAC